jgi:hypothetical protein
MGWRPQLNTFCTRCRKVHKPWGTCVTSSARPAGFRIKASFGKCPKCKRMYGAAGPVAHRCAPKSDFGRRKKQFEREQAAAERERRKKARPKHDYTECSDNECKRSLCVAYKKGIEVGDERGYKRGWRLGHARGLLERTKVSN